MSNTDPMLDPRDGDAEAGMATAYPAAQPPAPAKLHTEAEEEYLETLHAQLKPEAKAAYVNYYLARTPPHLQQDMKDLIEGDIADAITPDPPPA